jgi:hypothetical protein
MLGQLIPGGETTRPPQVDHHKSLIMSVIDQPEEFDFVITIIREDVDLLKKILSEDDGLSSKEKADLILKPVRDVGLLVEGYSHTIADIKKDLDLKRKIFRELRSFDSKISRAKHNDANMVQDRDGFLFSLFFSKRAKKNLNHHLHKRLLKVLPIAVVIAKRRSWTSNVRLLKGGLIDLKLDDGSRAILSIDFSKSLIRVFDLFPSGDHDLDYSKVSSEIAHNRYVVPEANVVVRL